MVTAADEAEAVVQGYSPSLAWKDLAEASYALARDIPWVASNTDMSVPTARGSPRQRDARGSGRCGDRQAADRHRQTPRADHGTRPLARGCRAPLVIGDRLDTDIAAARAAAMDSLLVLTGVNSWRDLLTLSPAELLTFVAPDLRFLHGHRDALT